LGKGESATPKQKLGKQKAEMGGVKSGKRESGLPAGQAGKAPHQSRNWESRKQKWGGEKRKAGNGDIYRRKRNDRKDSAQTSGGFLTELTKCQGIQRKGGD
jgi:hypothetical protein